MYYHGFIDLGRKKGMNKMKNINWKILIITALVCLLPIVLGIIFYQQLPEQIPVHFNINNEADNYASKNFALFGIPIILTGLQIFCCIITDWKENKETQKSRFLTIIKWFVPILSIVVSTILIEIPLGSTVDVRKSVCLVIGIFFILIGNYFPKMSYEMAKGKFHPMPKNEKMYRKMARMFGYTFVISGIALLISILFPPIFTVAVIIVLVLAILIESGCSLVKKI